MFNYLLITKVIQHFIILIKIRMTNSAWTIQIVYNFRLFMSIISTGVYYETSWKPDEIQKKQHRTVSQRWWYLWKWQKQCSDQKKLLFAPLCRWFIKRRNALEGTDQRTEKTPLGEVGKEIWQVWPQRQFIGHLSSLIVKICISNLKTNLFTGIWCFSSPVTN